MPKTYVATARFGATSDTLDADGEVVEMDGVRMPSEAEVRAVLPEFTGEILQTPPMVSALKIGGERLYELHRRGVTVERKPRRVRVDEFALISTGPASGEATFEVACSSGTYVRSLVSDLAASLGTGAYLTALRRTATGHLRLDDAASPDDLTPDTLCNRIIQPKKLLGHLPAVEVSAEERKAVCNGGPLGEAGLFGSFRVECGGELLAVYRGDGEHAIPEVVLCGG